MAACPSRRSITRRVDTLSDNNIRDGEVLLLTSIEPPSPERFAHDPFHTVAHVDDDSHQRAIRVLAVLACLCAVGIGAAALAWSGLITRAAGHIITGALLAAAAAVGSIVSRRASSRPVAVRGAQCGGGCLRSGRRLRCRACRSVRRQRPAGGRCLPLDGDASAAPNRMWETMFDGNRRQRSAGRGNGGGLRGVEPAG